MCGTGYRRWLVFVRIRGREEGNIRARWEKIKNCETSSAGIEELCSGFNMPAYIMHCTVPPVIHQHCNGEGRTSDLPMFQQSSSRFSILVMTSSTTPT